MRRKWSVLFLILLFLYLLMELFFPLLAAGNIRRAILNNTDEVQNLEVEVDSFPAWEVIFSSLDRVRVRAEGLSVNELIIDSIYAEYRNAAVEQGRIVGENTDLNLIITEQDLNKYIKKKYSQLKNFRVKFNPEQAYMAGYVDLFDREIEIQLSGKFVIRERNQITFVPENIRIEKLQIPGRIIEKFLQDVGFAVDLGQLELPLKVEQVRLRSARFQLLGGLSVRKAGLE